MGLLAEIDGEHVPLESCDWVLWAACGCPLGVAMAASRSGAVHAADEDAAWKVLYHRKRDIERAQRRGEHMELMTHVRWGTEVMPRMKERCTHG